MGSGCHWTAFILKRGSQAACTSTLREWGARAGEMKGGEHKVDPAGDRLCSEDGKGTEEYDK